MTDSTGPHPTILGSLRSAEGAGVVRLEDRYDTTVEDMWDALTDPGRLSRWYGKVEGDLRPGGRFRTYLEAADIEAVGRVEECEPPRRMLLNTRETEDSYERGQGVPPFDEVIEVVLTPVGDQTDVVIEIRGLPLDKIAMYGAGWQIHVEHLAAHVSGRDHGDDEARWGQLVAPYQDLARRVR
jgi:uncharacterized protein YndB with AHSA1/START domain